MTDAYFWSNTSAIDGFNDAWNAGDPSIYWAKSADGGQTCPLFGDGTAILSHDLVRQELETYCQRLVSGERLPLGNHIQLLPEF